MLDRLKALSPQARAALLTECTRLIDGNKLADYRPYPKQQAFHASGGPLHVRERLLRAGNQLGKTWSAGFEHAMHLTGRYPDWWKGAVFDEPTIGWAASDHCPSLRHGTACASSCGACISECAMSSRRNASRERHDFYWLNLCIVCKVWNGPEGCACYGPSV